MKARWVSWECVQHHMKCIHPLVALRKVQRTQSLHLAIATIHPSLYLMNGFPSRWRWVLDARVPVCSRRSGAEWSAICCSGPPMFVMWSNGHWYGLVMVLSLAERTHLCIPVEHTSTQHTLFVASRLTTPLKPAQLGDLGLSIVLCAHRYSSSHHILMSSQCIYGTLQIPHVNFENIREYDSLQCPQPRANLTFKLSNNDHFQFSALRSNTLPCGSR